MKPSYQIKLARLNASLDDLARQLEKFSQKQLNAKPAPDAWSALQVLQHLTSAESLSMQYLQKKLVLPPDSFEKTGAGTWLRCLVLRLSMMSPLKFKAPKAVNEETFPQKANFEQVVKNWRAARLELARLLESIEPDYFSRNIYKHPRAGKMTVDGMLDFFQEHFDRHRRQIERALKSGKVQQ